MDEFVFFVENIHLIRTLFEAPNRKPIEASYTDILNGPLNVICLVRTKKNYKIQLP